MPPSPAGYAPVSVSGGSCQSPLHGSRHSVVSLYPTWLLGEGHTDGQAVTCLEEVVTILWRLSAGGARGSPRRQLTACRVAWGRGVGHPGPPGNQS